MFEICSKKNFFKFSYGSQKITKNLFKLIEIVQNEFQN